MLTRSNATSEHPRSRDAPRVKEVSRKKVRTSGLKSEAYHPNVLTGRKDSGGRYEFCWNGMTTWLPPGLETRNVEQDLLKRVNVFGRRASVPSDASAQGQPFDVLQGAQGSRDKSDSAHRSIPSSSSGGDRRRDPATNRFEESEMGGRRRPSSLVSRSTREDRNERRPPTSTPDFIAYLVANTMHHRLFLRDESDIVHRAKDNADEDAQRDKLGLDLARNRLDFHEMQMYRLVDLVELPEHPDIDSLGEEFIQRLRQNTREHDRLTSRQQDISSSERRYAEIHNRRDRLVRQRVRIQTGGGPVDQENVDYLTRQINRIEEELFHRGPEFFDQKYQFEAMQQKLRAHSKKLYELAAPLLIEQGLIPERGTQLHLDSKDSHDESQVSEPESDLEKENRKEQTPPVPGSINQQSRDKTLQQADERYNSLIAAENELVESRRQHRIAIRQFEDKLRSGFAHGTRTDYHMSLLLDQKDVIKRIETREGQLSRAKKRAKDVGVLPEFLSSDFGEYPEDDVANSAGVRGKVDRDSIHAWMSDASARGSRREEPQDSRPSPKDTSGLNWLSSPREYDSHSCTAYSRRKRVKIDSYRGAGESLRAERDIETIESDRVY